MSLAGRGGRGPHPAEALASGAATAAPQPRDVSGSAGGGYAAAVSTGGGSGGGYGGGGYGGPAQNGGGGGYEAGGRGGRGGVHLAALHENAAPRVKTGVSGRLSVPQTRMMFVHEGISMGQRVSGVTGCHCSRACMQLLYRAHLTLLCDMCTQ